jgi:hypothetical protein
MKGLSHRLVLITATIKEGKKLLGLFEAKINEYQWKNIDHIWGISAKNPEQFPDWLAMVNYLTE